MAGFLRRLSARRLLVGFFIILPVSISGQVEHAAAHADPVAPVVLALAVILAAAKIAGHPWDMEELLTDAESE